MENLGRVKNVLFINDSKATTIESVKTAVTGILSQFPKCENLFLLVGGKDKNLPWEDLNSLGKFPQVQFIFFGQCGELAKNKSLLSGPVFKSLETAFAHIQNKLVANSIVLLSPGGTSLDQFKNFEERGNYFKLLVKNYSNLP
jgi:UDP-N-acetylmuramoylalanine--D-glutamate ligase